MDMLNSSEQDRLACLFVKQGGSLFVGGTVQETGSGVGGGKIFGRGRGDETWRSR